jgi:integrase
VVTKGLEMLLTEIVARNLTKPGRYTDDQTKGLHLWVKPNGKRYWIHRYTVNRKRHGLSLGAYPETTLRQAREKAIEFRHTLNKGINPLQIRIQTQKLPDAKPVTLFREFALAYIETMRPKWRNAKHGDQWVSTVRTYAFPVVGDLMLEQIDTPEILKILQPIWSTKPETASRLRGRIEQILTAAIVRKHRPAFNPAAWAGHLEVLLPASQNSVKHHAALPYQDLPAFMALLREMDCLSALALEFCILNASRTDEVLKAKWSEIRDRGWTIPGDRMKAGKDHHVPLSKRSLDILTIARSQDRLSEYVFSRKGKHMSNMAMLNLAKRLNPEITVHGFRSCFRDWISEETELSPELAEMQLAHTITNRVERAYRRGNLLEKRRKMMDQWAEYCQGVRANNVTSIAPSQTSLTVPLAV